MASWSHSKGSSVQSARCPVHGSLVVQTLKKEWIWRCANCLDDAVRALRRLRIRSV